MHWAEFQIITRYLMNGVMTTVQNIVDLVYHYSGTDVFVALVLIAILVSRIFSSPVGGSDRALPPGKGISKR